MILAPLLLAALPQSVSHVKSVLPVDGDLLELTFADADGDGLRDLFLAVREEDGERVIQVHRLRADGAVAAGPDRRVVMKKDIVSWGVGDFLPEHPGVELLLTTRGSAFALPTQAEGYRGIHKIGGADFLLDLPSHRQLPFWPAVADLDGDGRDEVALPTWTGFRVFAADGAVLGDVELKPASGRRPALDVSFKLGPVAVAGQPLADLMVPDEDPSPMALPPAAYASEQLPLPWFADADGDGRLDLLYEWQGSLFVHRLGPEEQSPRFARAPDLVMPYESGGDWEVAGLELVDAGGGPAVDLMVTRRETGFSLAVDWEVLLFLDPFRGQGKAILAKPDSIVATETDLLRPRLADLAPADGRPDLVLSCWSLDVGVLGGGKVDIEHRVLGYAAREDGGHGRRPVLSYEREYDADDFTAFSVVPAVPADLLGDGGADLLESDSAGVLEVRAIRDDDGDREVSPRPQRRFEVEALGSLVLVEDLDGDQIGDLVVRKPEAVEVYVARRR